MMNNYPIPVHCELKSPKRWMWRKGQYEERLRVERCGALYLLVFTPSHLYEFFSDFGMDRVTPPAIPIVQNYNEHHLHEAVKGYLITAEQIYRTYWYHNQQGAYSKEGRPDMYFEIKPDWEKADMERVKMHRSGLITEMKIKEYESTRIESKKKRPGKRRGIRLGGHKALKWKR